MIRKRLLTFLTAVVMLLTICIPAYAADTTGTEISYYSFDQLTADSGAVTGKAFAVSSTATGTVAFETVGERTYANSSCTNLLCNYKTDISSYLDTNPVLSFKYDVFIPNDDYKNETRQLYIHFSAKAASNSSASTMYINYSDGKFKMGTLNSKITSVYSAEASYTPGNWTTVELRAYHGTGNKLTYGVYVGDTQIFYGTGTQAYSSVLALYQIKFEQTSANYNTYLDEVKICAIDESNKPTEPTSTVYPAEINYDSDAKTVTVSSKMSNYDDSVCLIVAVFDADDNVEKVYACSDVVDNCVTKVISDENYIKNGYTIKAFVFDSLTDATPLAESRSYTLVITE